MNFFKSEKLNDNSTVITVLKDDFNFFDINLKDCKFITNSNGFIADEFTYIYIKGYVKQNGC